MLNRSIPPAFKEISNFEIVKAESSFLDNGIPFHILKAGNEPVIRLELIFKAGHWYEPHNGISYFTTKLLSSGTSNLSSKQIEKQIAQYGAFLELGTGYDRSTITIYSLSKYLNSILPLVSDMITNSIFPYEEIENLKTITSQNLKVNLKKTSFLASKNFRELLFGESHPYGRSIDETAISGITQENLKHYHNERFSYKDVDIILSGNGTEDFHKIINTHLGTLKWGSPQKKEYQYSITAPTNNSLVVSNPESIQSSIRMGCNLFSIDHSDYFKLNLLIEIFGGYFGSRLMRNIREEKGYTYGINAGFNSLRHSGYMSIGTDVNKENTINTIREIIKEMRTLKTEPVSKEELLTVTNYLAGSFISSLSTPFGLADKFKTIYFHELNYDFYSNYMSSLKTITSEDLIETAKIYFDESKIYEVIAGSKL
jgi:zinc protease